MTDAGPDPLEPIERWEFLGWDCIIRQQVSGALESLALKGFKPVVRFIAPAGMGVAEVRATMEDVIEKREPEHAPNLTQSAP